MKKAKVQLDLAGKPFSMETGVLALQADGSILAKLGDTVVLATAVMSKNLREGMDYFPLLVDYEERLYAAGKIKGSRFIKREGRATDARSCACPAPGPRAPAGGAAPRSPKRRQGRDWSQHPAAGGARPFGRQSSSISPA